MPPLTDKKGLTLAAAKIISSAAEAEAEKNGWKVVIAVVDDGGHLIHLLRRDDTQAASVEIAQGKARTAVAFRRPTKQIEDMVNGGRVAFLNVPGLVPLEGGVPIMIDGRMIGAVGVSGVASNQDVQICEAGIAALLAS